MRIIFNWFWFLITGVSFAQTLHFEAISTNFDLPSKECYNIVKDSKGYLWWSSEQGLSVFNGSKIKVFNRQNGLEDKASYALAEDTQNRLWIYGANRTIYFHKNGKIHKAPFSDFIKAKTSSFETPYSLDVTNKGKILVINTNKSTFEVDLQTYKVSSFSNYTSYNFVAFQKTNETITLKSSFAHNPASKNSRTVGIVDKNNKLIQTIDLTKSSNELISSRPVVTQKGNNTYFAIDTYLVVLTGKSVSLIKKFPQRILSISIDKQNNFWIGMRKKGLFLYKNSDLNSMPTCALTDLSVSGILVDENQEVWCTTLEKGVFRCRNANFKWLSGSPENSQTYEILKTVGNRMFTANNPKSIVELNNYRQISYTIPGSFSEMFRDIVRHNDKWYIASHQYIAVTDSKFSKIKLLQTNSGSNQNALSLHLVDKQLYFLNIRFLGKIKGTALDTVATFPFKIRSGCHLEGNKWLLASSDLLCILDSKTGKTKQIAKMPDPVTCVYSDSKNRFWIATKGSGLYKFQNNSIQKYVCNGLEDALYISDIKQHPDNFLWLSTHAGIYRFDPDKLLPRVEKITKEQGFISNEIYSTAFNHGLYYAATSEGLCSFTPEIFKTEKTKPLLYFSELLIDGKRQNLNSLQKEVPYGISTLYFKFDVVDYQNSNRYLRYQLSGTQSKNRLSSTDYVSLDNLKPGKYQFKVWVPATSRNQASRALVIDFEIAKPFWQQLGFIIFFIVLGLVGITLLFRFLLNRYKQKEREKTQLHKLIAESKLAAIQAQMNPHFIFNAINAIQNYVLNNESDLAYDYLTQFSKLIRKVLQNNQSRLLPISDELETLKLYVSLEQLRFEQAFEYEVIIDKNVDIFQTLIPPMLIQPYIENAIWHGIMAKPKQTKGRITVEFLTTTEMLLIKISDNGVGREASQQLKRSNNHQSLGMSISSARLEMVQRLYETKAISIEVTDLSENGQINGTLVQISIPVELTLDS